MVKKTEQYVLELLPKQEVCLWQKEGTVKLIQRKTTMKEDSWISCLSESYENLIGEPNLELKVITLNINEGHNRQLMEQCQILREYAQYVAKVREYAGTTDLDTAVEQAVNDCIQNGILAGFLRANKSEVIAMSIFEYDKEEEERKLRKAEYEAGRAEGIKEGIETGRVAGRAEGALQKARETAVALQEAEFSVDRIAELLQVDEEIIEKWLKEFFYFGINKKDKMER